MTIPEPQTMVDRFHRIASYFMLKTIESLQSIITFTNSLAQHAASIDSHLPFSLTDIIFLAQGVLIKIAICLLIVGQVLDLTFTHICQLWYNDDPPPHSNLPAPLYVTPPADPPSAGGSQSSPSGQPSAAPIYPNPAFHESRAVPEFATTGHTTSLPANQQAEIPALLQYIATFLLERYLKEKRVVDLAVSIDALELAQGLWSPQHPHRPNTFDTLAIALFIQYRRNRKVSDLSKAIATHKEALDLLRPDEPVHSSSLKVLRKAALMWCRQHGGNLDLFGGTDRRHKASDPRSPRHLNQHQREQVRVNTASPSSERHSMAQDVFSLHDTAVSCLKRYRREGGLGVLAESIQLFHKALSLLPPSSVNRPTIMSNLACVIHTRYERSGEKRDLANAINLHGEALSLRPPGHPDRPDSLNNLGIAIHARYQRDGGERDLVDIIYLHREALSLQPTGNPYRPSSLNNLAVAIMARYERGGDEHDLKDGIDLHREALSLRPPGNLDRTSSLNNLAVAIMARHERDGEESDLAEAIELHREALSLRPTSNLDRPASLNNLAAAIMTRYEWNGGERDLADVINLYREALSLFQPGHPNHSASLNSLACAIYTRYQRYGAVHDLSAAIDLHQEALSLRPLGHPDRPSSLSNFAVAIMARHERDGEEHDLTDAIDLHREALSLRPTGNPDRPSVLHNLANAIMMRYDRDGGERDLADVIDLYREADSLFQPGHPNRSSSLNSLAVALMARYERGGGERDLAEVIDLHRKALSLRLPGHPDRPSLLNNLANSIMTRYERDGEEHDLTDVIDLHREVFFLRPSSHPKRSDCLNNLANAIMLRYERDGEERDLADVIDLYQEALSLRPPGHPDRSASLQALAKAMFLRVRHFKDPVQGLLMRSERDSGSLIQKIIQLLREAAAARTSPIPHRLNAALLWGEVASRFDEASALEAYRLTFELLASALALGRSMQDRRTNLLSRDTRPLATRGLVLDASLWALFGPSRNPKLAVELLDQGRNPVLASVGQLRADLSDVRQNDPALADEFSRISRLLDSAILTGQDVSERKSSHEDPTNWYKRVSADWEAVVAKIRLLPGCESFLLPAPYVDLQQAASKGPVIVIVVGGRRSTAIIVTSKGEPHTVDLPDASEDTLKSLHEEWEGALLELPDQGRVVRKLPRVLSELWDILVQPIVHTLQNRLGIPLQSRIWWYPTSWASFLPLHAAGSYNKNGPNVPDLYISSYTPTLQALRRAHRDHSSLDLDARPGLLMVSQPETEGQDEIVDVNAEVDVVRRLVPNVIVLSGDQGTRVNVLREMRDTPWVHFACHGVPDPEDPFQSHFALHGGPLSLQDIITDELPSAAFAYLSACHSAAQDRKLPDEGLTLAGGMQFAGFKSVVGTLWKMADEDAPTLAKVFYKSLAKRSGDGKAFDCTKTAEALHDAVKELRKKKVPLFRWVNLVHYGI